MGVLSSILSGIIAGMILLLVDKNDIFKIVGGKVELTISGFIIIGIIIFGLARLESHFG